MINVLGDAYGAGIVEHLSRLDLDVEYCEKKSVKGLENIAADYETKDTSF